MSNGMQRRDFLKVLGVAGAGATAGCAGPQAEKLIPYVVAPEEIVPGVATWYRTTCRECPAGCGMSVRTREGRAVKVEGNPLSPISHGRLCARGQASIQGLYDPDRIPQALARGAAGWEKLTWDEAERRLAVALGQRMGSTVLLTSSGTGALDRLLDEFAAGLRIERVRWEPYAWEPVAAAHRLLYGFDGVPVHDFSNAGVVVSFGADFMETWVSPVDYAHGYVQATAFRDGRRGRFISVAPHQSLTDMNADEWLAVRPGTEHLVALALAKAIVEAGADAGAAAGVLAGVDIAAAASVAGIQADRILAIAREFANGGRSLAVGPGIAAMNGAATTTAAAVAVLNAVAGNVGRTVRVGVPELSARGGSYREMERLVERMAAGGVGALLVHGANPLYALPDGERVAAALERVPFIASFSTFLDETSERADLLLPDHHFLESWGDYEPRPGIHSLIQPVMQPVFATKQTGDVLLSVARRAGATLPSQATTFHAYLRERWQQDIHPRVQGAAAFDDWWREALTLGVVAIEAPAPAPAALNAGALGQLGLGVPVFAGDPGDYYLVVYPSYRFYDGRLANRPWLQELPDPVSKVSWSSWVEVHPAVAAELGLDNGSLAEVRTPHGAAELPVWIHPGIRRDTIAVQLGGGHEALGRYAQGRGTNAVRLLGAVVEEPSGALVWQQTRASLRPTGDWVELPHDGRLTDEGRGIVRHTTLAAAITAEGAHGEGPLRQLQGTGGFAPVPVDPGPTGFPPPGTFYGEYSQAQPRWGMAIDLERCIGCSACVTACYAENNIGIVGPQLVSRDRILNWMRIERYYAPAVEDVDRGADFLPMLCQHCGTAPCEPVCPVYAAYHTPDGLNAQVYNRCVGTRYCANNCPYKVRYFNWFTWEWPEPLNWGLNPDVTVREKGVMEKCTFCVQRIRDAQQAARLEGRAVPDGEIVPACAQTCPGDAIVFGDLRDPASRVARIAASGRGYRVLDELNTQPAIIYLKKVVAETPEG